MTHVCMAGLAAALLLPVAGTLADVRLPKVFGNDMIFQRDMPLKVWGTAEPGEAVKVSLGPDSETVKADDVGNWMATLAPIKEGKNLQLVVTGKNSITYTNIVMGEVWVCSGQSNMGMTTRSAVNGKQAVAEANFPDIRLIRQPNRFSGIPRRDVEGSWEVCSSNTVGDYSAAAYFFAQEVHKRLNVPVGLIVAPWGGSSIEPWIPPEGFGFDPDMKGEQAFIDRANSNYARGYGAALDALEAFVPRARKAIAEDQKLPVIPSYHHEMDSGGVAGMYRGMIAPFVPFAIRGALWYQGESNLGQGMKYCTRMKALIGGWRAVWNQGNPKTGEGHDFPFYYVQIAAFAYAGDPLRLPELWEAQTAALAITNTGMAVITDVSMLKNIHPTNKQPVGYRLALWALAKTYGMKDLVYSGPLYKAMAIEGNKVRLAFDHVGGGLMSRDGKPLNWFTIAGESNKFVEARAEIDGAAIVVSSEAVARPLAVRFAWHQEAEPNLMNKEGLPASAFRTDKWTR